MALDDIAKSPVAITDAAAAKVREFAQQMGSMEGKYLRIFLRKGGCAGVSYGFSFDKKDSADRLYTSNGIEFIIDDWSVPLIEGSTVDYATTDRGSGFTVKNPYSARNNCCGSGCG